MEEVTEFSKLPIDEYAKIPDLVIVPCPKKGTVNKRQPYRVAKNCCPSCGCFRGIGRVMWASTAPEEDEIQRQIKTGELAWSDVYVIRCATIYEIPCQTIDVRKY